MNQNGKFSNFATQSLDFLFSTMKENLASNVVHLYHYIADNLEDEFISASGDACQNFASKISYVKTISMMSDIRLNISQLRILL